MPRAQKMARNANGVGNIRKIVQVHNGKEYVYWQARYTAGFDPGTGKQIQRSITGKSQKEVSQKLKQLTTEIDQGTYTEPCKMTLAEWLDIWTRDYLAHVKPRTKDSYKTTVRMHLKPGLGALKLEDIKTEDLQRFINSLIERPVDQPVLTAKTIRNINGVLHRALQQAQELGYIRINPDNACKLPKAVRKEIKPLDDEAIKDFVRVCQGHQFEGIYIVTLFTGLREGEVLGLTWDCVDFRRGMLTINKQLQRERKGSGEYHFLPTKSGKTRYLTPAPYVMEVLKRQQERQNQWKKDAGKAWSNPGRLVFTNELGGNLSAQTVYLHFKKLVAEIDCPDTRFHDLRHSYAVTALRSGDDIKTVQENLGHHTAAFTLDVYAHVTAQMKTESANRMQNFISSIV